MMMDELGSVQDQRNLNAATQVLQIFGNFTTGYNAELNSLLPEKSAQLVFNPVKIETAPCETASIIHVIKSDNIEMKKIVLVFSTLCLEARELLKEYREQLLPRAVNYSRSTVYTSTELAIVQICEFLPTLSKVVSFMRSASTLFFEMMHQLNAYYILAKHSKTMSPSEIHLADVLDHAGRLLFAGFNMDMALSQYAGSSVIPHLQTLIQQTQKEDAASDPNKIQTHLLLPMLRVISETCYRYVDTTLSAERQEGRVCDVFVDEVKGFIVQKLNELDKTNDSNYQEMQEKMAVVLSLFSYYFHVLGTHNDKMLKRIFKLTIDKFTEFIVVDGNFMFYTRQFLFNAFQSLRSRGLDERKQATINLPFKVLEKLDKSRGKFYNQMKTWSLKMDSVLKKEMSNFTVEELATMSNLFLQGVEESGKLRGALVHMVTLHVWLNVSMARHGVAVLFELVEVLKVVRETFFRHMAAVVRSLPHIIQRATFRILTLLNKAKVSLRRKHAKNMERVVDCLSALEMAEQCLAGPATASRVLIARIALSLSNQRSTFQLAELQMLSKLLQEVNMLSGGLLNEVENNTCCDFLAIVKSGFNHYLFDFLVNKDDIARIKYTFEASEDYLRLIAPTPEKRAVESKFFRTELFKSNRLVWNRLRLEMERQLRLLAHIHVNVLDPCLLSEVPPNCTDMLNTSVPFLHGQRIYHLKEWMGMEFDESFYTLVAINPRVWGTYSEMRCLAQENFGVSTIDDDHLPSHTWDQGPDILHIVRNLQHFGAEYKYHMNDQLFKKIPLPGQVNDTRCITVEHVTNSLRQHGTGIIKTTVNALIQYLTCHLQEVIKIIFKDTIKNSILREISYFKDNKESLNSMYPVDRAIKLNRNLKIDLDNLQLFITEIGNVLGLVRMIHAGALRCYYGASRNLPDCTDWLPLSDRLEHSSDLCAAAAKALDEVVDTVRHNDSELTDYFKEILYAYSSQLQEERFEHMQNFHMIVPALTLNYCTKSINHKTHEVFSAYYDDGFFMGLAFVLSITNCNSEFDSLNWFDSTENKYNEELVSIRNQRISQADLSLMLALDLSANKYSKCQEEFELCHCLLTTAKVFFREDPAEPNTKTDYFY